MREISDEKIMNNLVTVKKRFMNIGSFVSCYTHFAERYVKFMIADARNVCGTSARDGFIRATLESRKNTPSFESKNHF